MFGKMRGSCNGIQGSGCSSKQVDKGPISARLHGELFVPTRFVASCLRIKTHSSRFYALHPEPLPSAQKRYENEILRIMSVLESVLSKSTSGWLVGDKCTYADTSFMFWNIVIIPCMKAWMNVSHDWTKERFPYVHDWHERLLKRKASVKAIAQRDEATKKTWQADLEESQRQTGRKDISNPEAEGNEK